MGTKGVGGKGATVKGVAISAIPRHVATSAPAVAAVGAINDSATALSEDGLEGWKQSVCDSLVV